MEMSDFVPLYHYSLADACRHDEDDLWRQSHEANIACKQAIEEAIRQGFDGMHLTTDCAASVIAEHGYKRTAFVLANTLKMKDWDGRFSHDNQGWAKSIFVPSDARHNHEFTVESHPAVLDGFVVLYRKAFQELGLFGPAQCVPNSRSELDYTGKVLVLSPDVLKESYWAPENQLWLASSGFGCRPTASGRAVYATCLGDDENARWDRGDFIGQIRDECMPDWAVQALERLQASQQTLSGQTL